MGFLKRIFGGKEVVVDPAHLTLHEVMPTDEGTTMRKAPGDQRVVTFSVDGLRSFADVGFGA